MARGALAVTARPCVTDIAEGNVKPPLTDPPDSEAGTDARSRPRRGRGRPTFAGGRLDFAPRPIQFVESRPDSTMFRQKRRIDVGLLLAMLFGVGTLVFVGSLIYRAVQVDVSWEGMEDGDSINGFAAAATELRIDVGSQDKAESATLTYDGEVVEEPETDGATIVWRPPEGIEEGEHSLELTVPRAVLGNADFTWDFTIDSTPPALELPPAVEPVNMDQASSVAGRAEEGTTVTADGQPVEIDDDGAFTVEFSRPPAGPVEVEAVDAAGNATTVSVVMPVTYPATRGVHVTGPAWESDQLRGGILQLIDEGRIDTVVLDLKDEGGTLHYDSAVPRAQEIGAVAGFYDLESVVAQIEERGARVIGRIVTFRDPALAQAAWAAGQGDQVVQTPDGRPWAEPGEYTNPASAAVRHYNLAIAREAVGMGVDDIMWDDVRRPSGTAASMVLPGLTGSPEDSIVGFLAEAHGQLRRRGARQGVTTVGVAADRGELVAQDVGRMARNADYVAPILYPGYWSAGELGVANPQAEPGELVRRALERYAEVTAGSGAVLTPWIQDFMGYGEPQVRAQIDGARASGVENVHLWNNGVRYTAPALDPGR